LDTSRKIPFLAAVDLRSVSNWYPSADIWSAYAAGELPHHDAAALSIMSAALLHQLVKYSTKYSK